VIEQGDIFWSRNPQAPQELTKYELVAQQCSVVEILVANVQVSPVAYFGEYPVRQNALRGANVFSVEAINVVIAVKLPEPQYPYEVFIPDEPAAFAWRMRIVCLVRRGCERHEELHQPGESLPFIV
jgi:hypothetical protein